MGQAMNTMRELGDLDQLENLLRNASNPAALAEADMDRVRDLLGDDAARSLERLAELTKMLTESARTAPAPIAAPLADLGVRLDAGWSVEPALRILAEDLDSATGDMVVSALILGMRDRGGGLTEVLTRMADGVANDVSVRRSVESEREKPRATARIVILITLGVAAWFAVFNPGFLAPYSSPVGQVVLALICLYMAACLLWLKKLASNPAEARFLNVGGAA